MYEQFFEIQRAPFSMVPDLDCIFMSGQHADAISGAVFGVMERKGFLILTGEAGLGKTTAVRSLVHLLGESEIHCSLIIHPTLNAAEFLEMMLLNFGITNIPDSKAQRLRVLEEFLNRADEDGKVCALIVDEAHKLNPDALEEVRLLGNLERNGHKLLQIILAGQNELVERLNLPELWQLKQRIAYRLSLKRMDRATVEDYIRFRWEKAGGQELPFDEQALDAVAHYSRGIPRVINAICDNSLLVAFSLASSTVTLGDVREACLDLDLSEVEAIRPAPSSAYRIPAQSSPLPHNPGNDRGWRPASQPSAPTRYNPANPPKPIAVEKPTLAEAPAPTHPQNVDSGEPAAWAEKRPSLLKRWLGLSGNSEADNDAKHHGESDNKLSLKRYM